MDPLPWYRIAAPVAFVALLAAVCAWRDLPRFRAMLLGIGTMTLYAAAQDQVSARLCPEYFTHFHNPIPGLTDPTAAGVVWGFLGSWWGGALMGYAAGIAATVGRAPAWPVRRLVAPMLLAVAAVGFVTAVTGTAVALYADGYEVVLTRLGTEVVPADRRAALLVVSCYHLAAYASAVAASVALCVWVGVRRAAGAPVAPAA